MSDHWIERISDYIDGALSTDERTAFEAHLVACPECSSALEDVRRIVSGAASLEDRPPENDLWPGIADRLGLDEAPEPVVVPIESRRSRRRHFTFTLPQLAAAGIAVVLLSWTAATMMRTDGGSSDTAATSGDSLFPPPAQGVLVTNPAEVEYADAVGELMRILEEKRDQLDPETVETVEENLGVIDAALTEIRQALEDDPGNTYLHDHLADTMQRKLDVLRTATGVTQVSI